MYVKFNDIQTIKMYLVNNGCTKQRLALDAEINIKTLNKALSGERVRYDNAARICKVCKIPFFFVTSEC